MNKNMTHRLICIVLVIAIMIPTGAFAATETGNVWDKYRDELKLGIMKQQKLINIDFGTGVRFASEGMAIQAITEAYNKAIKEIPNYFEINIIDSKRSPIIESYNGSYLLKGVRHDLNYYNDFAEINNKLSGVYAEINTKEKYHEKIRVAYEYIIENLHYKSGATNNEILVGSTKDWNKEASPKAYAILFSIIMDKLGYENHIITGKIRGTTDHAWNIVKVQGNWYHVDTKLGDVNYYAGDRENLFLTSYEKMIINYKHVMDVGYPEEYKTVEEYNKDNFINNEINFIINSIGKTTDEVDLLREYLGIDSETEGINNNIENIGTLEELMNTKNRLYDIKSEIEIINKKVTGYSNNIDVLKLMGVNANSLNSKLNTLKLRASLYVELNEIEQQIIDKEKQILANDAINLVEIARRKVQTNNNDDSILPEGPLLTFTEELDGDVKKARVEVKGVKDITIKSNLGKTLDNIVIIIKALKSVNTIEIAIKPSTSSINNAKNDTEAIVEPEYVDMKNELRKRINTVNDRINITTAEELVVKAENSLTKLDYDKADTAVTKLKDSSEDQYSILNKRVKDILDLIKVIEAVGKAENTMKANKETNQEVYKQLVLTAKDYYDIVNEKYEYEEIEKQIYNAKFGDLIESINKRIEEMETVIIAIKSVDIARENYEAYISNSTSENEKNLSEKIIVAKNDVSNISDSNANLKNIKNYMNSILKVFSDRLTGDSDYTEVSGYISELETSTPNIVGIILPVIDNELIEVKYKTLSTLEDKIASIDPLLQKVTDKRKSIELKERITALRDVIAATKATIGAEDSDVKTITTKISTATKAIEKLNNTSINYRINGVRELKENLEQRIKNLNEKIKTSSDETKARTLVDKALNSKKESDIKTAIEAIGKLEEGTAKENLKKDIADLINVIISNSEATILTTITNIERKNNNTSVNKDFTEVKKVVSLAETIVIFANEKLSKIDKHFENQYKDLVVELNKDIEILDNSVIALNAVKQAENYKNQSDVNIAQTFIENIDAPEGFKFFNMKNALVKRIDDTNKYLTEIKDSEAQALASVKAAELPMKPNEDTPDIEPELLDFKYNPGLVLVAKSAIKNVHDTSTKKDMEARIIDLETAQAAIVSYNKAKVYPIEINIKAAEVALGKVGNTYFSLIKVLNKEIAELYNNLNKSKSEAYKESDNAIANSNEVIKRLNRYIAGLIGPAELPLESENIIVEDSNEFDKDIAYGRVRVARNHLMDANDSLLRLSNTNEIKSLTSRIKSAHEYIDEADDKIDVKETIRLVDIASESVNKANSETDKELKQRLKEQADFDIRAAKLAIARVDHADNKEIKSTITKNLNLIEKRLTSNNDQELIGTAYDLVNKASNLLANAVAEDTVDEKSVDIGNAIWGANLAIVGISNDNKEARGALQRFIDEISELFELEKGNIANEDRIKNAKEAVEAAKNYSGNNEDERSSIIRAARLRINIIRNTGPDTKVIIDELNIRLDALEGKTGSGPGGSTGSGSGSSGSGSDSGKTGTTTINPINISPTPHSERVIGVPKIKWGETKELKKVLPVTGNSYTNME